MSPHTGPSAEGPSLSDGEGLPFARCLGGVALVAGVFLVNITSRVVLAPLLPAVELDLGIGHGQAGLLFFYLSLGYCVGLLSAGFVSSRLTHRGTIVFSAVGLGGVLLGLGATHTLAALRAAVVLVGAAAGLYLPSGVATVTSLVERRDWGKALALHELAPNLGFMVAPAAAEALLRWGSWRSALAVVGGCSVAVGVAFWVFGRGGRFRGQPLAWRSAASLASVPGFRILLILFALGLAASLGVYSMLPLYLTSELGFSRGVANTVVGLSRASCLLTVLGAGWLSDRLGPRRALMAVLAASGGATVALGLAPAAWILPAAVLQPVASAWFFPAAFVALSALGPLAVSLAVPFAMVIGGGAAPALIGFLGQHGAFGTGIVVVGVLTAAGTWLAGRLER